MCEEGGGGSGGRGLREGAGAEQRRGPPPTPGTARGDGRAGNSTPPFNGAPARSVKEIVRSGGREASGLRQREAEDGAAVAAVLGDELAAVALGNAGRDGEAETAAVVLRRVERLGNTGEHRGGGAPAPVTRLRGGG